jgi:stalled ribosome rescue protein Dom34
VLVNDDILGDPSIQAILTEAERAGAKIEVFNSDDEAGEQLKAFRGIACIA